MGPMFKSVGSCRGKVEQAGEGASLANGGVKLREGETEQAAGPTLTFLTRSLPPILTSPAQHTCARPQSPSIKAMQSHYCNQCYPGKK